MVGLGGGDELFAFLPSELGPLSFLVVPKDQYTNEEAPFFKGPFSCLDI
jgi:hypothetical protein